MQATNLNLLNTDKSQRELALDVTQSFIVQAPAGSGKTELLIQRFLILLNHVNKPEEILAITFTKKAANEMRSRVIKALKYALSEPEPEAEHAKKTWHLAKSVLKRDQQFNWHLINNPNQLRIQTIDALCAYLTKQLPLLSHFGSQPDIADNPSILYREAVQEVLLHLEENVAWSEAIAKLLVHLDNDLNKLHDLLISLLAKRDQWLPYIQLNTDNNEIRRHLESHLAAVITYSLQKIRDVFPKQAAIELLNIARFAADNLSLKQSTSEIMACRNLSTLPGTHAHNKTAWLGLARLLLTKSFSWRKRVDEEIGFPTLASIKNSQEKSLHTEYRQRLNALIESLQDNETLKSALTELFFLPYEYYQDEQWEILKSLLSVLKIVAAQLRLSFQQHGQIDFIENAQAALFALGNDENPTDLALALDYQIKHILVDEFQDTSFSQYQLLEKLITGWEPQDGRTLFVVGDPMQSIYRFREAEVGLFIRMRKNGIGHLKLIPLTLSTNFRSAKKIVDWNNSHFQFIFPSFNDIATGAVTYSKSVAINVEDEKSQAVYVETKGFLDIETNGQANYIVSLIEKNQLDYPKDNIAILVRSRSHLSQIIPALKKAKILYRAVDIDPLIARQTIQDLLSLTCALLHPADRIAWLSILRAPWCGLTLTDLWLIAGENPYQTIWEQITNPHLIQKLSSDGQLRLTKILPLLKKKIADRERYPLRYWIESTWLSLGGPAALEEYADIEDANAFFNLLSEFNQTTNGLNVEKLKEKISRLYATTQHVDARVQIMTIHTAKGLEFDTVILPHLERKLPNDNKALLSWMEQPLANDTSALLLAPIHASGSEKDAIYEYINREQRIKADYEIARLFYVATTRAKKRLHLLFNTEKKEDGDFKADPGSFLKSLWPLLEKNANELLTTPLCEASTQLVKPRRYIKRFASHWQNPIMDLQSTISAKHQQQSGFYLPDHKQAIIGTVTHRLLQQLSKQGILWWTQRDINDQNLYLAQQLAQLNFLPKNIEAAISLIQKAIQTTLNDARGQWILKSHTEAKSELTLTAVIEEKLQRLIIDRTFVDEQGIRWIIDYKTTGNESVSINNFLKKEQEKYHKQMQFYYQAMRHLDDRPIRLGLYFPLVPAWHEWEPGEEE